MLAGRTTLPNFFKSFDHPDKLGHPIRFSQELRGASIEHSAGIVVVTIGARNDDSRSRVDLLDPLKDVESGSFRFRHIKEYDGDFLPSLLAKGERVAMASGSQDRVAVELKDVPGQVLDPGVIVDNQNEFLIRHNNL
jgi:hypothetical protein